MGTTYDQAWIVKESPRASVLRRHVHVYELSSMAGRVGPAGLSLFAVPRNTHQRRIRFNSCQGWRSDQTCRFGSARTIRKSGTTRCHAQEDDVESHQGHARFRQRIDGYDYKRMFYSQITERRNVKRSYGGTVANESDAQLCERPHLSLDPTKLETLSLVLQRSTSR